MKFVNDMVSLQRETGGLEPRARGNGGGHGKLRRLRGWLQARMKAKPDLALDDLVLEVAAARQVTVHRVSVWRPLRSLGLTRKIAPQAVKQKPPEIRKARHDWIMRRQSVMRNMLPCVGFIDATSLKTKMAKTTGWMLPG